MVVITGTFFMNLLCGIVSCDPKRSFPEIVQQSSSNTISTRNSNNLNQFNNISDGVGVGINDGLSLTSGSAGHKREILPEPFATTNSGQIEGFLIRSTEGRRIYAFEGIPYAMPPIDDLRFKAPVSIPPWKGVLKAQRSMPECLQLSPPKLLRIVGVENCLFLSIYSPNVKSSLPVVFLIHGGSFYFGAGRDYGPAYLLNKQIVLVTINYRLGVLGFLSSGDKSSPGNYGLKDQALALKWVYENIENFGGDREKITIIGQSSGAASSHHLLLSEKTRPYINSGFSMSGSSFNHFAFKSKSEALRLTQKLATFVNCPVRDSNRMISCLRRQNPVTVVSAQLKLLDFMPFPLTHFSPVIEPESPEAIITKSPDEIYTKFIHDEEIKKSTGKNSITRDKRSLAKPWIFGITADEGYLALLFLQSFLQESALRRKWTEFAPVFLDYKYFAGKNVQEITSLLTTTYFGSKSISEIPKEKIAELFGDRFFLYGFIRALKMHSQIQNSTYAYIFDYKGKYSSANIIGVDSSDWGVSHTEDLFYLFNSTFFYEGFQRNDKDEYRMSMFMTTMLANFATDGKPTPDSLNIWNPVNTNNSIDIDYLSIGKKIQMKKVHSRAPDPTRLSDRVDFWENLRSNKDMRRALNLQ